MARDETPPFPRGATFLNGAAINTTDYLSTQLPGYNLEGKEWLTEDTVNSTGLYVRLRAVRNASGVALVQGANGSKLVQPKTGYQGRRVSGYTTQPGMLGYPIDDAYKSGYSIPNNDLFYIVVEGPVQVQNAQEASANTPAIADGDLLVSCTGGVSTAASTSVGCVETYTNALTTNWTYGVTLNYPVQQGI